MDKNEWVEGNPLILSVYFGLEMNINSNLLSANTGNDTRKAGEGLTADFSLFYNSRKMTENFSAGFTLAAMGEK